ncbi:hypothetical protein, partial [Desertihabitans aurantiacus]|uniref:hypothetical protein n=1 Tax=Desertihabitans aurantiacus TaxID=2282477 RepID=UPI0018E4F3E1
AAEQLVEASTLAADHLGAWVLARRGSEAAAAATALQPFEPTRGCWFHPEHPRGTERRTFEGHAVPCCRRCADAVDAGREPPMLDLPGPDGEPVHFHRSGAEPWASTGYGATEPDLPARLGALR